VRDQGGTEKRQVICGSVDVPQKRDGLASRLQCRRGVDVNGIDLDVAWRRKTVDAA